MKIDGRIPSLFMLFQGTSRVLALSSRSILSSGRTAAAAAAAASSTLLQMSTTVEAAVTNPLLEQDGLPKFESIDPTHLTPAVEELLTKLENDFATLETDLSSSDAIDYDEVLPVIERMQYPLGYVWGVAGHLNGVKNGDELREAYESNQPKVVEAMTKFSQSKPLYDALSAIEKQWSEGDNDEDCSSFLAKQKQRAVENSLLQMRLGGVGLDGAEKERFNEIKQRLAKLSMQFSNNVLDDTKAYSRTITDPATMEGVPESAKAQWANAHIQHEAKEGDEAPDLDEATKSGPWRITLDIPSYLPVMSHLKDRAIREEVYKAYIQKASEKSGDKNNVPLIYEILSLKTEMAKILGFSTYAELSLAKKMAATVEEVTELTDLMAEKAIPAATKELEEITALAKEGEGLEKLEPWDITFWVSRSVQRNRAAFIPRSGRDFVRVLHRNSHNAFFASDRVNV